MPLERTLVETFVAEHPREAASALEAMAPDEASGLMAGLSHEALAALMRWMSSLYAARALELVEPDQAAAVLDGLRDDVAAACLRAMQRAGRAAVLQALGAARRERLGGLLRHAEGTAGALMDCRVLALGEGVTAEEALARVRAEPDVSAEILYVVEADGELLGVVELRRLLAARPADPLGALAERAVQSLAPDASREAIVSHPGWQRFRALPVVGKNRRLLGELSVQTLRELESELSHERSHDPSAQTGIALAELYGVGVGSLLQWAAVLVRSREPASGGQP